MLKNMKQRIGYKIRIVRRDRRLTQAQLAEACSLSVESISNIERGIHYPSFENLTLICHHLKCPISDILDYSENITSNPRFQTETKIVTILQTLSDPELEMIAKMLSSFSKR